MDIPIQSGRGTMPGAFAPVRKFRRGTARLWLALTAGVRLLEPMTLALGAVLVLSAYFLLFPGVDLAVSGLFHDPVRGFALSGEPLLKALRKSSSLVLGLILFGVLVLLATQALRRRRRGRASARRGWFLLAGLVVGPGLVVNTLLKDNWGRPRPVQIDAFGGEAAYVDVWRMSEACQTNCSFVSGESSSAAWMVAALVLVPAPWRRWAAWPVVAYAAALSLNRLAFGGHFLSDILLSWAITGLVLAVLHRLMVASPGAARRRRRRARTTALADLRPAYIR